MLVSGKGKKGRQRLKKGMSWFCFGILLFLTAAGLTSCYCGPSAAVVPSPAGDGDHASLPLNQLYFYPNKGQTVEKQSRDHYECYNGRLKMTGLTRGNRPFPGISASGGADADSGMGYRHDVHCRSVLGPLIGGPYHAGEGALIVAAG